MNHKSITYDIDDWEIISENKIEYRYIENTYIENIYNENWYSNINDKLLTLNLQNKEVLEDKKIKDIIEDAKKSWNDKIQNNIKQNEYTKKRKIS